MMKRKAVDTKESPQAKRQKEPIASVYDVHSRKDDSGSMIWPASSEAIENARKYLREW